MLSFLHPAIIVVDMVQDNFHDEDHLPIAAQTRAMIPGLSCLLKESRSFLPAIAFWKAISFFLDKLYLSTASCIAKDMPGRMIISRVYEFNGGAA